MSESISYVPLPDKLSPADEIDCEETLFFILMPGSSPKKGFFVVLFGRSSGARFFTKSTKNLGFVSYPVLVFIVHL